MAVLDFGSGGNRSSIYTVIQTHRLNKIVASDSLLLSNKTNSVCCLVQLRNGSTLTRRRNTSSQFPSTEWEQTHTFRKPRRCVNTTTTTVEKFSVRSIMNPHWQKKIREQKEAPPDPLHSIPLQRRYDLKGKHENVKNSFFMERTIFPSHPADNIQNSLRSRTISDTHEKKKRKKMKPLNNP